MNSRLRGVETEVLNLETVHEEKLLFKIPSYQRPYTWSEDDVLKFFDDIKNACEEDIKNAGVQKNTENADVRKESHYFIGTTLSSKVDDNKTSILELVDGQQRITTLMLICLAFKQLNAESELSELAVFKDEGSEYHDTPRLQFDIRKQVQKLFAAFARHGEPVPSTEKTNTDPFLTKINEALIVLQQQVSTLGKVDDEHEHDNAQVSVANLSRFIYQKVQWVNNIVPPNTDLNRLFATMNTAGVQLEQSDILKARLLKQIETDRPRYEAMWLACEQMDNYFERNVRQVFSATNWGDVVPADFATPSEKFKPPQKDEQQGSKSGQTIEQLMEQSEKTGQPDSNNKKDDKNQGGTDSANDTEDSNIKTICCRSIIHFPLLLIHAYRIYLVEKETEPGDIEKGVHSKDLLEIFSPLSHASNENEIRKFIETLWRTRYAFDRWVVKWVWRDDVNSNDQRLGLTDIAGGDSGGTGNMHRIKRKVDELLMLQSVCYYTGDRSAQYWLTPFLAGLLKDEGVNGDKDSALKLLQKIDNQMSLAKKEEVDRKKSSFALASDKEFATHTWCEKKEYFTDPRGTGFEHYWFQKLEYVLWLDFRKEGQAKQDERFKEFRITSKNSVEHVYPQKVENGTPLADKYLNAFGNLALLSPGENSSYSNRPVPMKRAQFHDKHQLSSLKLYKIFTKRDGEEYKWNAENIRAHQEDMIKILTSYYDNCGDG